MLQLKLRLKPLIPEEYDLGCVGTRKSRKDEAIFHLLRSSTCNFSLPFQFIFTGKVMMRSKNFFEWRMLSQNDNNFV